MAHRMLGFSMVEDGEESVEGSAALRRPGRLGGTTRPGFRQYLRRLLPDLRPGNLAVVAASAAVSLPEAEA